MRLLRHKRHRDLEILAIEETITTKEFCQRYRDRLEEHPTNLAANLMKARRRDL